MSDPFADRHAVTEALPVRLYLDHKRGTIKNLFEGENWFNMLHGVFHESKAEIASMSGNTGVCFDIDGSNVSVRNPSERLSVTLVRGDSSAPLPWRQMRIL